MHVFTIGKRKIHINFDNDIRKGYDIASHHVILEHLIEKTFIFHIDKGVGGGINLISPVPFIFISKKLSMAF